jgi:hypothetical protein
MVSLEVWPIAPSRVPPPGPARIDLAPDYAVSPGLDHVRSLKQTAVESAPCTVAESRREGVKVDKSSPARLFATLVGGALVIAGISGFFYDASFDTGRSLQADDVFGVLSVNGWHNLVHITTGLLGLACAGYAARQYSLGLGLAYVILAIWGFTVTKHGHGDLLDLIPINTEDNFLHLIIGLTGLAAGAATTRTVAARASRPKPAAPRSSDS